MTYGFSLLTVGALMMYSAWSNSTIAEVMRGLAVSKGGPGDTGFISLMQTPVKGMSEAVTRSGGTGPKAGKVPAGITVFEGERVCKWIAAELRWARKHGGPNQTWRVSSGYRDNREQAQACAETSGPCADPGTSNHQGKRYPKCAVDIENAAELDKILSRKPGRRLKWTGPRINDDVHFSSGLTGV